MIDILFLLVMFFLLSSSFTDLRRLDLDLASSGVGRGSAGASDATAAPPVLITIDRPDGAAASRVSVDGATVELSALRERLNALAEKGATEALILARRGADLQDLVTGLDIARSSELRSVRLLTR